MIILYCALGVLGALLLFAFIAYLVLSNKHPNADPPAQVENKTGLVQAVGRNFYDEKGKLLFLQGVNLGNWFTPEFWMSLTTVGSFDTGLYTQKRGLAAMRQNPNLTEAQIQELENIYLDNYITEDDFKEIARLNFNCVRFNFTYLNLTTGDTTCTLKPNAFDKLDWAVAMCKKYGLYCIPCLHGAIGSQNRDIHSGDDEQWGLYTSKENRAATIALWEKLATHFKGESTIVGYDLLNEPRRRDGWYGGKINFDFYDELYRAIRAIEPERLIFVECFAFPFDGVHHKKYGWTNVCYQYHIYNLTLLPQRFAVKLYNALHNLMGYHAPVYIGEFNAYAKEEDWVTTWSLFERFNWSYCSWTYKVNAYAFAKHIKEPWRRCGWGMYELNVPPVDLSGATYEEIKATYEAGKTENAREADLHAYYEKYRT